MAFEIDQETADRLVKESTIVTDQGEQLDTDLLERKLSYVKNAYEMGELDKQIGKVEQEDLGLLEPLRGTALESPVRFLGDVGGAATKGISDLVGLAAFVADKTNPMTALAQSAGLNPRTYSQDAAAFEKARNEVFGTPDYENMSGPREAAVKAMGAVPLSLATGGASTIPSLMLGEVGGVASKGLGLPEWVGNVIGGVSPEIATSLVKPLVSPKNTSAIKSFLFPSLVEKQLPQVKEDIIQAARQLDVGVAGGAEPTNRQIAEAAKQAQEIAQQPNLVRGKIAEAGGEAVANKLDQSLRKIVPDQDPATVQEGVLSILGSERVRAAKDVTEAKSIVASMIDEAGNARTALAKQLDKTGLEITAPKGIVSEELKRQANKLPPKIVQEHGNAVSALKDYGGKVPPSVALSDLESLTKLRRSLKSYSTDDMAKLGSDFVGNLDSHINRLRESISKTFLKGVDLIPSKQLPKELQGQTFDTLTNQLTKLFTTEEVLRNASEIASKEFNVASKAARKGMVAGTTGYNRFIQTLKAPLSGGLSQSKGTVSAATRSADSQLGLLRSLARDPKELEQFTGLGSYLPQGEDLIRAALSTQLGNRNAVPSSEQLGSLVPDFNAMFPDGQMGGMNTLTPEEASQYEQLLASQQPAVAEEAPFNMPSSISIPIEEQALNMSPEQDLGFDPTLQGIGNIDSSSFYDDKVNIPDESVLQEKEQNAEQIGTLPRGTSALVNLSEAGKDLSDLGFSDEVAKSAGSLLGGSQDDQRQGLSLLMQDKPSLFEQSPLPGYNSLVDGIIQDNAEKLRFQQKIRDVFRTDPVRQAQAIEAVRRNEAIPKWSYKYLGGEDQTSFEDKFLQDVEGMRTKAYLDTKGNPTIGIGVNLAAQSLDGLRDMSVPEEILQKISPLIGVKGERVKNILKYNPVELSEEEAMTLSKAVQQANYDFLNELVRQDTGATLEDLPIEGRTVLLSLGYNFGSNLKKNKPEIWNAAMSGKWDRVQSLLKGMNTDKKGLRNRRLKEAALLNPLVDKKMELAMNTDVDMPAVDGTVKLSDGTKKTVYRF
jgi:GH24 family phage-related lysozyme (muramidase)